MSEFISFKINDHAEVTTTKSDIMAISKAQDKVYLWFKNDPTEPWTIGESYHTALRIWAGEI